MSKNRFFIRQYSLDDFFHGGIGYSDAEKILMNNKFVPVLFPHYGSFSMIAKLNRFFYLLKMFFVIPNGSRIVFLFPVYARMNRLLLGLLRKKKNIRIICFVADIDGIKDGDENVLKREIATLNRYRYFIVHNESMRWWLASQVPDAIIAGIEFFDFLAKPFEGSREKNDEIVFAGNLEKSRFLEELQQLKGSAPALHFNLYGPGVTETMVMQKNVTFKGIFPPYGLPPKLEGSFGLVWDGDAIDHPGGSLGNYMQYISHHKLSLYIVSGLPLIVPDMAASAPLVKKYGIGITIKNLFSIQEQLDRITADQYQQMKNNLKPLADRISTGKGLELAVAELLEFEGGGKANG